MSTFAKNPARAAFFTARARGLAGTLRHRLASPELSRSVAAPGLRVIMMEVALASLRRRGAGILVRDLDGDLLILDTEADRIHQLNRTASYIWRHVDEAPAAEQLARLLVDAFQVDVRVALTDVVETLTRFRRLNLIVEGA